METDATIGRGVELFCVKVRAVRYYEERGLLAPPRDRGGRRVYDPAARKRLQLVAQLRRADVPVEEISQLLDGLDVDEGEALTARSRLERRRLELERQLGDLRRVSGWLDAALEGGGEGDRLA